MTVSGPGATAPATAASPTASAAGGPAAAAVALAALAEGTRLAGRMLPSAGDGRVLVATTLGVLALDAPAGEALPAAGSRLTLLLGSPTDGTLPRTVRLLPAETPMPGAATRPTGATAGPPSPQALPAEPIPARLLTPLAVDGGAGDHGPTAPSTAVLPAGRPVLVRIEIAPGSPTPAPIVPPSPVPDAVAPDHVIPPGVGTAGGRPLPPGTPVAGVVVGTAGDGGTVVRFAGGALLLPAPLAAAPGTPLLLTIVGIAAEPVPTPPPTVVPLSDAAVRRGTPWPALAEAIADLDASGEPAASAALREALPDPSPQAARRLRTFLAALSSRDLGGCFGPAAVDSLARRRPDLLARLAADVAELADEAERPQADGAWRTATVPLLGAEGVQPLRLMVRREADGGAGDDGSPRPGARRFVLDLTLSRLGRIQLDTLALDGDRRFEVIVRSERALPDDAREAVRRIGRETGERVGVAIGIGFRAQAAFVNLRRRASPDRGVVA